jgi:sugar phosphate isomerase/epimerase
VYPDDLLPNVEKTAPQFDDVEIVLFESLDRSNLPSNAVLSKVAKLGKEYDTTFTVHFPIDKKAGSDDPAEREAFREQAKRVVGLTKPLDPIAFLLHLEPGNENDSRETWASRVRETCGILRELSCGRPEKISVENLGFPHEWLLPIADKYGFSFCLDTGHALKVTGGLDAIVRNLMSGTRVIHLHGWDGENDHLSLARMDRKILAPFIKNGLKNFKGVLTLEVFSESETFESVEALKALWQG